MRRIIDRVLNELYYWSFNKSVERGDIHDRINKFCDDHILSSKICKECCDFVYKYGNESNIADKSFEAGYKWMFIFYDICKYLGFNEKSASLLFKSIGTDNNWKHLHTTEDEKTLRPEDWFENFLGDVHYCSDRWTFTRLYRVQWQFCRWIDSLEAEDDNQRK